MRQSAATCIRKLLIFAEILFAVVRVYKRSEAIRYTPDYT